jgi:ABC-type Co2+ transport system permease subunit
MRAPWYERWRVLRYAGLTLLGAGLGAILAGWAPVGLAAVFAATAMLLWEFEDQLPRLRRKN